MMLVGAELATRYLSAKLFTPEILFATVVTFDATPATVVTLEDMPATVVTFEDIPATVFTFAIALTNSINIASRTCCYTFGNRTQIFLCNNFTKRYINIRLICHTHCQKVQSIARHYHYML